MALHPTCGRIPLQKASKLIAFADLIMGLLGIVWFVFMLQVYDIVSLEPFDNPTDDSRVAAKLDNLGTGKIGDHPAVSSKVAFAVNHKVISLILYTLYNLVNLSVFVVLLVGAHKKSIGLCLAWFYIRCAILVFKLIIFTIYLIARRPLFGQIPYMIFIIVHIYGIWVVNRFVEEIRSQRLQEKIVEAQDKQKKRFAEDEQDGIERIQHLRELVYQDNPSFTKDEFKGDKGKV